jgi:Asp/Glu/hydantoin racemase
MKLLVINPNTSASVTDKLRQHVGAALPAGTMLSAVTAPFGARYIADEASYAVAGHAALVAYADHVAIEGPPDAVLLGCFGDPGVAALRELSRRPVVGLAEAAFRAAAAHGRWAIVTGGLAWAPMLQRLARSLDLAQGLAHIEVVQATGAQLAADPVAARLILGAACRRAAQGVDAVILGGAGLAGLAADLADQVEVPLIDSVAAGAQAVLAAGPEAMPLTLPSTRAGDWLGVAASLAARSPSA